MMTHTAAEPDSSLDAVLAATVMVIDDDAAMRYTLARTLESAGYRVIQGESAADCQRFLAAKPDLIILDVRLPDANGFDVCRKLRGSELGAHIPVILISASFTRGEDHVTGIEGGADGYLTLPVDPPVLISMVKAWIRAHRVEVAKDQVSVARVQAQRLAGEALQKLETIITESPSGVALLRGPDLVFERLNDRWKLFVSERNYLGLAYSDVYPELRESDLPVQIKRVYETGQPFAARDLSVVVRVAPDANGPPILAERIYDLSFVQILDPSGRPYGVIGHATDVTEQALARQKMIENERDFADTIESMSDAFFSVDRDFKITRVNEHHVKATKLSREEQIGKNLLELFFAAPSYQASQYWIAYHRAMKERVFVSFEEYYEPLDLWTEVRVYPKTDGGLAIFFSDVTARKQVEQKVLQEQHKLEQIFEESPAAMCLFHGESLMIEKINSAYQAIFGERQILGKPLLEATPEMRGQEFPILLTKVLRTGEASHGYEVPARIAVSDDGPTENRYFDFSYTRVNDARGLPYGVYCYAMDVTARVEARVRLEASQAQLRQREEQLSNAVKVSRVGFYEWDIPTNQVTYSREMQRDWQIESTTSFEKALERIHPQDVERANKEIADSMAERKPFATEYRIVRADGTTAWIEAQGEVSYDKSGQPVRFFGTSLDITARKRTQIELEEAKIFAEEARREAERANDLKSAFLANMSHEIRTPLGAMLGFADLLRDPGLTPTERANYIDILTRNGESLSVIINDILDLSKVEAGHLTLEFTDTHPDRIASDVVSLLRVKAKEKDLTLEYVNEEASFPSIVSDPTRVRQILLNLVGNAIKFTQFGSVTLRSFGCHGEDGVPSICFEISDTGIGIAKSQREHIFEMFVQADGTMTRRFGGTGLGLALSRRLARALGGDVTVSESEEGVGTTFLVKIADQPNAREAAPVPARADKQSMFTLRDDILKGVKVLVVDDAPDNQQLIWRYLTKRGAVVEAAENGWNGYRRALEGDFDIVLMDIQMPVMDGYAATQRLRDNGYQKPIIALTAHAMTEVRRRALNVGYTDHLPKPINPKDLIEAIARFTDRLA